ncbi:MAG: tripartite tricarboxylate transporter substrate binding protein [Bradyrhizobium sp.]|nr:tripartite tricarboxylate transporter substrate binding protein [Bradyrhizobium sp.]
MRMWLVRIPLAILAAVASTMGGLAQTYPSRPVTIVVPFAAGGATDVVARLIGERLSVRLGKPFIVENKPGANGAIGSAAVAKAEPDGYTLVMGGVNTHAMNDSVMKQPLYSSTNDFAPIGLVAEIPIAIVVHASLGISTLPEFIKLAKEKPESLTYGSSGTGGPQHLAMEMFKSIAKLDIPHVPYRGGAPQLNDLVAGHIKIGVVGLPPVLPHLTAGTLRALAVVEGKRSELLPDVPTIAEQGFPGFSVNYWMGLLAPARTPNDVIAKLSKELELVLNEPDVASGFRKQGAVILRGSPEEFRKLIASEVPRWASVAENIGAKLDN